MLALLCFCVATVFSVNEDFFNIKLGLNSAMAVLWGGYPGRQLSGGSYSTFDCPILPHMHFGLRMGLGLPGIAVYG